MIPAIADLHGRAPPTGALRHGICWRLPSRLLPPQPSGTTF